MVCFPSKRDLWFILVVWAASIIAIVAGISILTDPVPLGAKVTVFAVCIAGAGFMLWALYGTAYTLTDDMLLIQSGPFRFRVPLAEIDEVVPSRKFLSGLSCSLSLDRLKIRYRKGHRRILVSPHEKAAFLRALVDRAPHLALVDDRVARVDRGPSEP